MDQGALNGLRGILALRVMVYHVFFVSGFKRFPNIYSFIDMPLFLMLSGFCLTLNYGKTLWDESTLCSVRVNGAISDDRKDVERHDERKTKFDSLEFYRKRLIRILPLHYMGMLASVLLW